MVKLLVDAGADGQVRDRQFDATPHGWADTAIVAANNPNCAEVVAYFEAMKR
jgi:hypothetical protein